MLLVFVQRFQRRSPSVEVLAAGGLAMVVHVAVVLVTPLAVAEALPVAAVLRAVLIRLAVWSEVNAKTLKPLNM